MLGAGEPVNQSKSTLGSMRVRAAVPAKASWSKYSAINPPLGAYLAT